MINIRTLLLLTAVSMTAIGCSGFPYRIDVDQGNIIDAQSLSRLQVGMSKEEVERNIGSPLLKDMFHRNRWDYVQYYKNGRTQAIQHGKVSLFFTNGLLSQIQRGNIKPVEVEALPYGDIRQ